MFNESWLCKWVECYRRLLKWYSYTSTFFTFKNRLFTAFQFSQHKLEEARETVIEKSVSSKRYLPAPTPVALRIDIRIQFAEP